jgi:Tripartite tricarboxylate transporter TctB family
LASKTDDAQYDAPQRPALVKSTEGLVAGLLLLLIGAIGFFGTLTVPVGTLAEFGAGMVPRVVAVLVGISGLVLMALAFVDKGPKLGSWPLRAPLCILGAVVAFGLTLRGFDLKLFKIPALGLIVAGPLAVTLSALGDPETRTREIVIFSLGLTALCIALFRFVLRLPIPIAPWALGY